MYLLHSAIPRVLTLRGLHVVSKITQCLSVASRQAVLVVHLVICDTIIVILFEQMELQWLKRFLSMQPGVIMTLASQNWAPRRASTLLDCSNFCLFYVSGLDRPCVWACRCIGGAGAMHDVQHVRCFIAGIVPSGGIVYSIGLGGPPTSSTFEARLHCNVPLKCLLRKWLWN